MFSQQKLHFVLLAFVLTAGACSKKTSVPAATWLSATADGQSTEWSQFKKKDGLEYAFANDAQNVYVCVRTSDRINTLKILRGGLQVWFDPAGGKAEKQGLRFPVPSGAPTAQPEMRPGQRPDLSAARTQFQANTHFLSATGFSGLPSLPTDDYAAFGVGAAATWDERDVLTLELAIPRTALGIQPGKALGVGLVLEAMSSPGGGGMPSGGGPGGGMPPGGMPPGGGMPGGGGDFQRMLEDLTIWNKVPLSAQP